MTFNVKTKKKLKRRVTFFFIQLQLKKEKASTKTDQANTKDAYTVNDVLIVYPNTKPVFILYFIEKIYDF